MILKTFRKTSQGKLSLFGQSQQAPKITNEIGKQTYTNNNGGLSFIINNIG